MVDLITLDLRMAFEKPGCPLCRLRRETEQRYLFHLLYESVNDGVTRLRLVQSMGLCFRHAWLCQAIEWEQWEDGLGTGTIYEDLLSRTVSLLTDFLNHTQLKSKLSKLSLWSQRIPIFSDTAGRPEKHIHTVARAAGRAQPSTPARWILGRLRPIATCPACTLVDRSESTMLTWLTQEMANREFRSWYAASDGLCLPHLQLALALYVTDQPSAEFLIHHAAAQLGTLLHAFRECCLDTWQSPQSGTLIGDPEAIGKRLVAFMVGESIEFDDSAVQLQSQERGAQS